MNVADRLMAAIDAKGAPVCIGLDPVVNRLPPAILNEFSIGSDGARAESSAAEGDPRGVPALALEAFCRRVIEVVAPLVPAVKVNIAFFERYGPAGLAAYERVVADGRLAGLFVIGDVKRADIGNTSIEYAAAHLEDTAHGPGPDAITVNPYFGWDSVAPFVETAARNNAGLFVLVQTSNPSAQQVQDLRLENGDTLCQAVARLVETWGCGAGLLGSCGFSAIGAVVSPRDVPSTRLIRSLMPHAVFLVPGFGAQGRSPAEVGECFRPDGRGALIAASRSVLFAYQDANYLRLAEKDWRLAVRAACQDMSTQIQSVIPRRM